MKADTPVRRIKQVHVRHRFVDNPVVLGLQYSFAVRDQELDEAVEKLNVALGRLKHEGVHTGAIFADTIDAAPIEFYNTLIRPTDNSFRAAKKAPCHNRGLSVDKCNLASVMMAMVAMMALGIRRSD
jgi:hypothetical protein